MIESFFCRPDRDHWCYECCSTTSCSLLGKLPDGSIGCLSHSSQTSSQKPRLPQRPLCSEFNCKNIFPHIDDQASQSIANLIISLPKGQFKVSKVISRYFNLHHKP